MVGSKLSVCFALVIALSLALGVFSGVGTSPALAAGAPTSGGGYSPVASTGPDVSYCYPSGYNRNGWRCGWRLAQAPYNLGDYNRYYGGYYYYYGDYGYGYPGGGTGGYPVNNIDYGGRPRFGPYYYNGYYYDPCYYYGYGYCYGYPR